MSFSVIIPAYNPPNSFPGFVRELSEKINPSSLVIVNDGSTDQFKDLFEEVTAIGAIVISHEKNVGKGAALKTGIKYLVENDRTSEFVLTCDADGQHRTEDVYSVRMAAEKSPDNLVIGARAFGSQSVPFRSRFGNILTRLIFRLFTGEILTDTQTGLRAIPRTFFADLLKMRSSGYEFELEMLVEATRRKIKILETPIATVYLDQNRSSHFNPLLDSAKIYFVFLRFLGVSILSAIIDFCLFSVFYFFLVQIAQSMLFARALSAGFNFYAGRRFTFQSSDSIYRQFLKYALLAGIQLGTTYLIVQIQIETLAWNVYWAKLLTEGFIFFASFMIQRFWVFKR